MDPLWSITGHRLPRWMLLVLMALGHFWTPSEAIFSKLRIWPSQSRFSASGRQQSSSTAVVKTEEPLPETFNISKSHGLEALPWFRSQKQKYPVTDSPIKRISLSQANFPTPFKLVPKPVIRYVAQLNYDTTTLPAPTTTEDVQTDPTTIQSQPTTIQTVPLTDSPIRRVLFRANAEPSNNGVRKDNVAKAPSYAAGPTKPNMLKLVESQIHYIKLPPTPYDFVPGLGYISRPLSPTGFAQDFMKTSVSSELPYIPIDVVNNGKFDGVYIVDKTTAKPTKPPAWTTETPELNAVLDVTTSLPIISTTSKPEAKPTDSRIIRLKGPYFFNGKPGNVFSSHSPYIPNYFEELHKLYSKLKI